LTAALRLHTDGLRAGKSAQDRNVSGVAASTALVRKPSAEDWSVEASEIAPLLETQQLVRSGSFTVSWPSTSTTISTTRSTCSSSSTSLMHRPRCCAATWAATMRVRMSHCTRTDAAAIGPREHVIFHTVSS
jgi:hypothetical protein